MNDLKLTVVVSVYGVEDYLRECLDSIRSQPYNNLEIILVDDGSKGNEPLICDEYAFKDYRVKVIHKENAGIVAARKTGVNASSSRFITFVDGDDFLDKDFYKQVMRHVTEHLPDMVAVSCTHYYNNETKNEVRQGVENGVYDNMELVGLFHNMNCVNGKYYDYGIFPSACLKVYRSDLIKEIIKDVPEDIKVGEDAAITFPYILKSSKVVVDNDIKGYYYRLLQDSMVRSSDKAYFARSSLLYIHLKKHYSIYQDPIIDSQLELYRAFLLNIGLDDLKTRMKYLDTRRIARSLVLVASGGAEIFRDTEQLSMLGIPEELYNEIYLVCNNKARRLELLWKRRLVLSYLLTMARRTYQKALKACFPRHTRTGN